MFFHTLPSRLASPMTPGELKQLLEKVQGGIPWLFGEVIYVPGRKCQRISNDGYAIGMTHYDTLIYIVICCAFVSIFLYGDEFLCILCCFVSLFQWSNPHKPYFCWKKHMFDDNPFLVGTPSSWVGYVTIFGRSLREPPRAPAKQWRRRCIPTWVWQLGRRNQFLVAISRLNILGTSYLLWLQMAHNGVIMEFNGVNLWYKWLIGIFMVIFMVGWSFHKWALKQVICNGRTPKWRQCFM